MSLPYAGSSLRIPWTEPRAGLYFERDGKPLRLITNAGRLGIAGRYESADLAATFDVVSGEETRVQLNGGSR